MLSGNIAPAHTAHLLRNADHSERAGTRPEKRRRAYSPRTGIRIAAAIERLDVDVATSRRLRARAGEVGLILRGCGAQLRGNASIGHRQAGCATANPTRVGGIMCDHRDAGSAVPPPEKPPRS
jgi:hypothetical protein